VTRLIVLPAAEAEVAAAAEWYEDQREGLGVEYVAEVGAAFERIVAAPLSFPRWRDDRSYRRLVLKRFPYLVFYRVLETGALQVVAVAHAKRRPGYCAARDD